MNTYWCMVDTLATSHLLTSLLNVAVEHCEEDKAMSGLGRRGDRGGRMNTYWQPHGRYLADIHAPRRCQTLAWEHCEREGTRVRLEGNQPAGKNEYLCHAY